MAPACSQTHRLSNNFLLGKTTTQVPILRDLKTKGSYILQTPCTLTNYSNMKEKLFNINRTKQANMDKIHESCQLSKHRHPLEVFPTLRPD